MPNKNKKPVLLLVFVGLIAALAFVMSKLDPNAGPESKPPPKLPRLTVEEATTKWPEIVQHVAAPARGNAQAQYSVVEFGDFECPQCGKMRPIIEDSLKAAGDRANLYFVHRPFPTIHKYAIVAAQASLEAADEGKFWPMYDQFYSHQEDLEPGLYDGYAKAAGADPTKIEAATRDPKLRARVESDSKFCDSLPVQETPTLLLRDNTAGKVIAFAAGKDEILKLLKTAPWASTANATAQAAATTDSGPKPVGPAVAASGTSPTSH